MSADGIQLDFGGLGSVLSRKHRRRSAASRRTLVGPPPVAGEAALAAAGSDAWASPAASLSGRPIRQRQIQREAAALPGLAGKANLAAQQVGELAADGQPEPGAAELPAGGHVGLLEGLEDDRLLVGGDADARV